MSVLSTVPGLAWIGLGGAVLLGGAHLAFGQAMGVPDGPPCAEITEAAAETAGARFERVNKRGRPLGSDVYLWSAATGAPGGTCTSSGQVFVCRMGGPVRLMTTRGGERRVFDVPQGRDGVVWGRGAEIGCVIAEPEGQAASIAPRRGLG